MSISEALHGSGNGSGISSNSSSSVGGTYLKPWMETALYDQTRNVNSQLKRSAPGSFESYAGAAGPTQNFTGITPSPVYSPELMNQASNAIWGNAMAQGANQQRQANSLRPGFGSMSPFLQSLRAGIQARAGASGMQNMLGWQQTAAQQNAQNILEGQKINLGAETSRAQAEQNRYAMMQSARAQDIQRENALQAALARYVQPLSFSSSAQSSSSQNF